MWEIAPTESHIELWLNVPKWVFVPVPLDNESLPDNSTIDSKTEDVSVNESFDDGYSVMSIQHTILEYNEDTIPFVNDVTSSTVTCNTTDDDPVGNTSLATLEVYEVNDEDIKFCFR